VAAAGTGLMDGVVGWFLDPANWSGAGGIPNRLLEHVVLSGLAVGIAAAIAVPVGLLIGHTGRGAVATVAVGNLGRAIPSYAMLVIFVPILHIGFANALAALVLLAIPPILTNTYAGMRGVDRDMVEAGRAMGMSELGLLRRVELPLALPVVIAGLRVAAVAVVATATLAALVGGGALGRFIVDGFALRDTPQLVGGAILVAVLAVITERAFTILERLAVSPGLRRDRERTSPAELAPPRAGTPVGLP
jgi:osmoprotectant transport system permease protein